MCLLQQLFDPRFVAAYFARRIGKKIESISKETMDVLSRYTWPGNIRELQNLMERAVLLSAGSSLRVPLGEVISCSEDEAADIQTLRGIATQAMDVLRQSPGIALMRDDWSPDSPQVKIQIDPDGANVVGISNADVANSTAAAISGVSVGSPKEGNKSIPIVARLRTQGRAQLGQIENLYVYSSQQNTRVPLLSVATVRNILETEEFGAASTSVPSQSCAFQHPVCWHPKSSDLHNRNWMISRRICLRDINL